jgi:hypothetical protein
VADHGPSGFRRSPLVGGTPRVVIIVWFRGTVATGRSYHRVAAR